MAAETRLRAGVYAALLARRGAEDQCRGVAGSGWRAKQTGAAEGRQPVDAAFQCG